MCRPVSSVCNFPELFWYHQSEQNNSAKAHPCPPVFRCCLTAPTDPRDSGAAAEQGRALLCVEMISSLEKRSVIPRLENPPALWSSWKSSCSLAEELLPQGREGASGSRRALGQDWKPVSADTSFLGSELGSVSLCCSAPLVAVWGCSRLSCAQLSSSLGMFPLSCPRLTPAHPGAVGTAPSRSPG